MDSIQDLIEKINDFSSTRDWSKFHTPSNLAKSISIEANELLECFQWDEVHFNQEEVADELADVLNYCLLMASTLHLDVKQIILNKMEKNNIKYPVEKAKGNSTKYNKL